MIGLLTASNASGQLVFLPALAALATLVGWVSVPIAVSLLVAALFPFVWLLLAETPAAVGITPYGASEEPPIPPITGNPFRVAFEGLARGARSVDFWLLAGSFAVCGFSTYGLIGTHMIAYCMDHGIPEVTAAGLMASLGVFDLFGTICSGWLTDRYNPRVLLFWYYGLRGLALLALPFSQFDLLDPVDLRGVLRAGLGSDGAADHHADQRGVRPQGWPGDRVVDLLRPPAWRRAGSDSPRARCATRPAATCSRSWPAARRACWHRCWSCASPASRPLAAAE